mmetsp:Transcript_1554/g.4918  ORF Transcript_1554/g.4918 Transcript_1554/m.4918 type:complete len:361 (+) Transcript_1554:470-1552(+)
MVIDSGRRRSTGSTVHDAAAMLRSVTLTTDAARVAPPASAAAATRTCPCSSSRSKYRGCSARSFRASSLSRGTVPRGTSAPAPAPPAPPAVASLAAASIALAPAPKASNADDSPCSSAKASPARRRYVFSASERSRGRTSLPLSVRSAGSRAMTTMRISVGPADSVTGLRWKRSESRDGKCRRRSTTSQLAIALEASDRNLRARKGTAPAASSDGQYRTSVRALPSSNSCSSFGSCDRRHTSRHEDTELSLRLSTLRDDSPSTMARLSTDSPPSFPLLSSAALDAPTGASDTTPFSHTCSSSSVGMACATMTASRHGVPVRLSTRTRSALKLPASDAMAPSAAGAKRLPLTLRTARRGNC